MNSCGIGLYKNASPFSRRDKVLVKSAESQSKCRNIFVLLLVSAGLHGGWKTGRGDAHGEGVGMRGAARSQGLTWATHVTPPPCDPAPCGPASIWPRPLWPRPLWPRPHRLVLCPQPVAALRGGILTRWHPHAVAALLRGPLTLSGCSVELDEVRSQSGSHNNCRVNYCSMFQEKQKALTFSKFHMNFAFFFWLWRPSVA